MLPEGGEVPPFALVDQHGQPFGSDDLRGRVWLGVALSPSSPEGRELGEKIKKIQHRAHNLGVAFHIVTITLAPSEDSPADLDAFVRDVHGSPRMWSFLTGRASDVEALLGALSMLTPGPADQLVWLVDPRMHVRARYDLREPSVVESVLRDVGLLANRGG